MKQTNPLSIFFAFVKVWLYLGTLSFWYALGLLLDAFFWEESAGSFFLSKISVLPIVGAIVLFIIIFANALIFAKYTEPKTIQSWLPQIFFGAVNAPIMLYLMERVLPIPPLWITAFLCFGISCFIIFIFMSTHYAKRSNRNITSDIAEALK